MGPDGKVGDRTRDQSRDDQNWSELSTSPLPRVPRARQAGTLTLSLTYFTEPSPSRTLAPPGCQLRAEMMPCSPGVSGIALNDPQSIPFQLGGATWLYMVAMYQANGQ